MENDELKNTNEEAIEPSSDSGDISEQELPNEEKKEESNDEKIQELFSDYVMKMPESEKPQEEVITDPNRPAHRSQRIAAGLIDLCLLFLSVWGLYRAFISSGLGDSLRQESIRMQRVADQYKLVTLLPDSEETYGYKLYEGEEGYDDEKYQNYIVYPDVEGRNYKVINYPGVTDELAAAYEKAVTNDQTYKSSLFNYQMCDFGIIALAGGISETVLFLVIPLLNKNRATLGKLSAGLQVINSKYIVRAKWYQMTGRYLWVYAVESALPLLFLPSVGFLSNTIMTFTVVPIVLFLITLTNKDRRTLHDFVCRTRVIDKRTFVPLDEQ